jgi:hypothetical protein
LDGIRLDRFEPGSIREVSPSIGSWLIAQGYAVPEMRSRPDDDFGSDFPLLGPRNDRRRG